MTDERSGTVMAGEIVRPRSGRVPRNLELTGAGLSGRGSKISQIHTLPVERIGRETPLPSGAAELVGLSRAGDLLLVEFKVGPANPGSPQGDAAARGG